MAELRRLRYFLAVAEARNFTRAAERLHVAQPALSRQVRLFEEELGVDLLRRTTHEVELTDAGAYLLRHGHGLLTDADELWRAVGEFGAGERGTLVLGHGTSAGYETAPRLVADLRERAPTLEVATRVLPLDEVLAGLTVGTLDAGIVRCPPTAAGLDSVLLRREAQGVILGRAHRFAGNDAIELAQLRAEPLLLHPRAENPGHYDAVLDLCVRAGFEPRILVRATAVDLAQAPVVAGQAVAIVGESVRPSLPETLAWCPLTPPAALDVRLLVRAGPRAPTVDRFLVTAAEAAEALGWLQ